MLIPTCVENAYLNCYIKSWWKSILNQIVFLYKSIPYITQYSSYKLVYIYDTKNYLGYYTSYTYGKWLLK